MLLQSLCRVDGCRGNGSQSKLLFVEPTTALSLLTPPPGQPLWPLSLPVTLPLAIPMTSLQKRILLCLKLLGNSNGELGRQS